MEAVDVVVGVGGFDVPALADRMDPAVSKWTCSFPIIRSIPEVKESNVGNAASACGK